MATYLAVWFFAGLGLPEQEIKMRVMGKRYRRTHAGLHRLHPTSKKANWNDRDKHRGFYIQISLFC